MSTNEHGILVGSVVEQVREHYGPCELLLDRLVLPVMPEGADAAAYRAAILDSIGEASDDRVVVTKLASSLEKEGHISPDLIAPVLLAAGWRQLEILGFGDHTIVALGSAKAHTRAVSAPSSESVEANPSRYVTCNAGYLVRSVNKTGLVRVGGLINHAIPTLPLLLRLNDGSMFDTAEGSLLWCNTPSLPTGLDNEPVGEFADYSFKMAVEKQLAPNLTASGPRMYGYSVETLLKAKGTKYTRLRRAYRELDTVYTADDLRASDESEAIRIIAESGLDTLLHDIALGIPSGYFTPSLDGFMTKLDCTCVCYGKESRPAWIDANRVSRTLRFRDDGTLAGVYSLHRVKADSWYFAVRSSLASVKRNPKAQYLYDCMFADAAMMLKSRYGSDLSIHEFLEEGTEGSPWLKIKERYCDHVPEMVSGYLPAWCLEGAEFNHG